MTLPRSSGCTRTSRTLPRRSDLLATWTSSGYWTMPRTRCSRASSSTSGSAPRLAGLDAGGVLARGVRGPGLLGVRLGLGPVLGGATLGGLGRPGLGAGLAFLRFLAGLALLGGGREALL